ncbi:DUF3656 domain-containing U32 family peptidase [Brotaphodocola sp.]|uniref:U32 family peptidase n=1 Tax=Brotaphodocola sp. TaxID=3073577 RepID=UPI003D7D3713
MKRPQVEVLAPAGSMESMKAAVSAGADAIYMGGSRYGARAYADNPEEDRFLEAIDYVHLHGKKIYMTVNTLMKEEELEDLVDYLRPYYERGLDAVIVQDLGAIRTIREVFPDLPVHASTQMTITGYRSAEILQEMGAERVVPARELSLKEIAEIHEKLNLEIECFVHGALCYCYSGQCLLSSLIGGRSGNRGRCAQPCRLPYEVDGNGSGNARRNTREMSASSERRNREIKLPSGSGKSGKSGTGKSGRKGGASSSFGKPGTRKGSAGGNSFGSRQAGEKRSGERQADESYVLSLKDLCTLDILPEILEAGVYSLKIEGRMRSPRYTAGVVRIYRKYVDLYLSKGRSGYHVDPEDRKQLLDLFDRGGQTDGYYRHHNGREMVVLKEKPAFRETNQTLFDEIDREYVNKVLQRPIRGVVTVHEGENLRLMLETEDGSARVRVEGALVQSAQNQPLTEEKLLKQMNKTGGASFFFEALEANLEGDCFVPVQALNELRRQGMEELKEAILKPWHRTFRQENSSNSSCARSGSAEEIETRADGQDSLCVTTGWRKEKIEYSAREKELEKHREDGSPRIHISLEDPSAFHDVLKEPDVDAVYLDAVGFDAENWLDCVVSCHMMGKSCYLLLPHIFRTEAEAYFRAHGEELRKARFDGMVLRSLDEIKMLEELGITDIVRVSDPNLYAMNSVAAREMKHLGMDRQTFPLELNSRELESLSKKTKADGIEWELQVYGYLPAMVSAQCVVRTTKGCTHKPEILFMTDRTGKRIPMKNHCRFCYNTIYNPSPLSLLGMEKTVERIDPEVIRLAFTIEKPAQIREIIRAFADHFRYGQEGGAPFADFTRGHMKRGVE